MARTYWTDERIDAAFLELRDEVRATRVELRADFGALRGEGSEAGASRAEMYAAFSELRLVLFGATVVNLALVALLGVTVVTTR